MAAVSARRTSTPSRRARRYSTQQIILTVVGVLVIAAFVLSLFASP